MIGEAMPTQPPPPPPAPSRNLRADIAAMRRQQRADRRAAAERRLRSVHSSVWALAGIGALVVVGAVGCQRVQQQQAEYQARTSEALAIAARGVPTASSTPPASVATGAGGMENPLLMLPLTPSARWMIGPSADGTGLLPGRSTWVVRQLIDSLEPCTLWLRLDDDSLPTVLTEPAAGAVPLAECDMAAMATTTTVG